MFRLPLTYRTLLRLESKRRNWWSCLKSNYKYRPKLKKGQNDVYRNFEKGFEEIGNIPASKGYRLCYLVNRYLDPWLASRISRIVSNQTTCKKDWQLMYYRYQRLKT